MRQDEVISLSNMRAILSVLEVRIELTRSIEVVLDSGMSGVRRVTAIRVEIRYQELL